MKHYMDISRIKETGESELTMSNTGAFEIGRAAAQAEDTKTGEFFPLLFAFCILYYIIIARYTQELITF